MPDLLSFPTRRSSDLSNFSRYARERLSGFIEREVKPEDRASTIFARDMVEFGDYFNKRTGSNRGDNIKRVFCNGPLKYVGQRSEEHTSELQSLRHLVCQIFSLSLHDALPICPIFPAMRGSVSRASSNGK